MSLKQSTTKFALCVYVNAAAYIVACITVAMQQQREGWIYQGRFWATAR
jgi:hypothetical protein